MMKRPAAAKRPEAAVDCKKRPAAIKRPAPAVDCKKRPAAAKRPATADQARLTYTSMTHTLSDAKCHTLVNIELQHAAYQATSGMFNECFRNAHIAMLDFRAEFEHHLSAN
jgi:hypothetical protein